MTIAHHGNFINSFCKFDQEYYLALLNTQSAFLPSFLMFDTRKNNLVEFEQQNGNNHQKRPDLKIFSFRKSKKCIDFFHFMTRLKLYY